MLGTRHWRNPKLSLDMGTHHSEAIGEKNQEQNEEETQCTLANEEQWY